MCVVLFVGLYAMDQPAVCTKMSSKSYIYIYIYIYTVDIGATFPKTGECRAVKKISRASQANFTALSRFKPKINYNSCN